MQDKHIVRNQIIKSHNSPPFDIIKKNGGQSWNKEIVKIRVKNKALKSHKLDDPISKNTLLINKKIIHT